MRAATRGLTLLLAGWYAVIFGALLAPADGPERTWFWLGAMFVALPVVYVVAER